MSSFTKLVDAITQRATELEEAPNGRLTLDALFLKALHKTINEVYKGAEPDDFTALAVINLVIMGADEGHTAEDIKAYITQLRTESN